jgi:glutaredoxin
MDYQIKVYGAEWCGDTSRTRAHLGQHGLDYEFIDIDNDRDAEQKVEQWGEGKRHIPVVEIHSKGETRRLSVPSNDQLDHALRESHVDTMGDHTTRRSGVSSGGREDEAA